MTTEIEDLRREWQAEQHVVEVLQRENNQMRRLLYLWNHGAEMSEEGWSELHAQTEHLISQYRG